VNSPADESANVYDRASRRWWITLLCLVCALAVALLSWAGRYSINPDGISYLDMADQLLKGNLGVLVHPYWSPLYPCLLAVALKIFSPTPARELLVVHLVNCLIGLTTLASFTFFLCEWSRLRPRSSGSGAMTAFRLHTAFAYALFLWGSGEMIGLADVSPDLCVAAVVFLTAGLCCRLATARGGLATSVALGVALSLGYFTKAAMLPLGIALLILLAIPRLFALPRRSLVALSGLVFFIAVAPHVFLLSRHAHRLSIGDSGRLNYAWLVLQQIPAHQGWIGSTAETGTPLHPLHVLSVTPTVIEFKDTVPGTYPLWYNPAYFYDGLRMHFNLRKQLAALARSAHDLRLDLGRKLILLFAGLIVLFGFSIRRRAPVDFSSGWLILWSLAAFCMYALVGIEPRYIAAFVVLFWIALYDTVSRDTFTSARVANLAVFAFVTAYIGLTQLLFLWSAINQSMREPSPPNQFVVATQLAGLGLLPGDDIATVGDGSGAYYARLAQLRVIAIIGLPGSNSDAAQLWTLSDSDFNAVKQELRQIGAKAIVSPAKWKCTVTANNGWHSIDDTGYCVQLLD
jgi:hypothetical protein